MSRFMIMAFWLLAAPLAIGADKTYLYLYDVRANNVDLASQELLPHRLYAKYEPQWDRWVMVLTDEKARLASPTEALLAGTVVKGSLLGDSNEHRYLLTVDSKWTRTDKAEVSYFWVNADPVYLKTVRVER